MSANTGHTDETEPSTTDGPAVEDPSGEDGADGDTPPPGDGWASVPDDDAPATVQVRWSDLRAMRARIDDLTAANADLRAENEDLTAAVATLREENADLRAEVSDLREAVDAREDEVFDLRSEVQHLEAKLAAAERRRDATIDRYERLLERRTTDGAVAGTPDGAGQTDSIGGDDPGGSSGGDDGRSSGSEPDRRGPLARLFARLTP